MTQYYCYSGEVEGPFYDTRERAREECGDGETARPIADSVVAEFDDDVIDVEGGPVDDGGGRDGDDYADWSHDDLKAEAEQRGLADDIDLREKGTIVAALNDDDN